MRLIFANTISHKRAVVFGFALEFTKKFVRHSLVSKVYDRAHYGWAGEKSFKIKVLRWLKNALLRERFASTVS